MIRSVTVTNHNNESITLDLFHPEWSGIVIDNIDGLGPPKATINSNEVATIDGGIFTSARMGQRNIVFTLSPQFNPTIEDMRIALYKYFPIKKLVHLDFQMDRRHAECEGYVESNTPTIFTNHETIQVSIICPDPFFYEIGKEEIAFAGTLPLFEFPFWNDSLTQPQLEFGDIRQDNRAILRYSGDVDTGVHITVHVMDQTAEMITIWNVDTRERIKIDTAKMQTLTGVNFGQGDDIEINTKIGDKYARLLHDGKYWNIISCINKDADWFQITAGNNTFTFTANAGESNLKVTFRYRNAYGGI